MTLLVDTSVWSLALRRDQSSKAAQVQALREALLGDEIVVTTGLILQELLQGFAGPRARNAIVERSIPARVTMPLNRCAVSIDKDNTIPLNRCVALIAEHLLNRLRRVTQPSRTIQRNRLRLSQARQPSR